MTSQESFVDALPAANHLEYEDTVLEVVVRVTLRLLNTANLVVIRGFHRSRLAFVGCGCLGFHGQREGHD